MTPVVIARDKVRMRAAARDWALFFFPSLEIAPLRSTCDASWSDALDTAVASSFAACVHPATARDAIDECGLLCAAALTAIDTRRPRSP